LNFDAFEDKGIAAPPIVWRAVPGSQTLTLSCPADVILAEGTRGSMKTDTQIQSFRRHVGKGYGRHWRGIIFDRQYKNLDDMVSKTKRWFVEYGDGARFLNSKSDYKWVWPTGEELLFRCVKVPDDYWEYHGQEFPFIGWNELTKYPDDSLFEAMMSCNRSSFRPQDYPITIDGDIYRETGQLVAVEKKNPKAIKHELPEIPLVVLATTNPYGVGHNWVKKRFIDVAAPGEVVRKTINVYDPRTKNRIDILRTQVRIFCSYKENIYLSPQYIATLESVVDPNKKKAWLSGIWDINSGGMFDAYWDSFYHVVQPFHIPNSWSIKRSFDWGSSKPFSVGWWAESDGSDVVLPDGTTRPTVRGDVFRLSEWYGCTGRSNEGLRLLDTEISEGIIRREMAAGLLDRVKPGPADNSIFDVLNGNSVAANMAKKVKIDGTLQKGVQWVRSDKSAGSRKAGWGKCQQYLKNAVPESFEYLDEDGETRRGYRPREKPGMFFFSNCKFAIELFPSLPRDEVDQDDVDTDSEDHIGDEIRYYILSLGGGVGSGTTKGT
jgi:hypothetical protein